MTQQWTATQDGIYPVPPTDVQQLAAALFQALGISVPCGSVTLNMNESRVDSVETKIKVRVRHVVARKVLDSGASCG